MCTFSREEFTDIERFCWPRRVHFSTGLACKDSEVERKYVCFTDFLLGFLWYFYCLYVMYRFYTKTRALCSCDYLWRPFFSDGMNFCVEEDVTDIVRNECCRLVWEWTNRGFLNTSLIKWSTLIKVSWKRSSSRYRIKLFSLIISPGWLAIFYYLTFDFFTTWLWHLYWRLRP